MRGLVLVHGGAGAWGTGIEEGVGGCLEAARVGGESLGDALQAAVAAVKVLESLPRFNAGLGATLTRDGTVELDAAVMTGDLRFGAIGACPPIESAIAAALAVYSDGEHALLVGQEAAAFAVSMGLKRVDDGALITEETRREFEKVKARRASGDLTPGSGTVGAVAVDASGRIAAATSTGGIIFKRSGRVGDTPLPGAGTYADSALGGAASATGKGEAILRSLLCREAVQRISDEGVQAAAKSAISQMEARVGGQGGLILIDDSGGFAVSANTDAMPWAAADASGIVDSGS